MSKLSALKMRALVEGLGLVGFVLQTLCCHKRDSLGLSKSLSCGQWCGAGAWWPHLSEPALVPVPELSNTWRICWWPELALAGICPALSWDTTEGL